MHELKITVRMSSLILLFECTLFLLHFTLAKSVLSFFAIIGLLCIIVLSKYEFKSIVIVNYFFLLLLHLVMERVLQYEFLVQARVLLQSNTDVLYWFKIGHIHAIRLLISYPAYLISGYCNADLNMAFSYYCCFIFLLILLLIIRIQKKHMEKVNNGTVFLTTLFVLFLSVIMNGRINFAFLGLEILILQIDKLYGVSPYSKVEFTILFLAGLLLTFVSSGTMIVAILYLTVCLLVWCIKKEKLSKKLIHFFAIVLMLILLIVIIGRYVLTMINKNIAFFGGGMIGVLNMFNHGITRSILESYGIAFVFAIILAIFIANISLIYYVYLKHFERLSIVLAINAGIYGAFFGLSAGTMCFIPTYILLIEVLSKRMKSVQRRMVV